MGCYVAQETLKLLIRSGRVVQGAEILIFGASFKEDVGDVRNTRVVELVQELENYGLNVNVHDPLVSAAEMRKIGFRDVQNPFETEHRYDAVVLAVAHRIFRDMRPESYVALLRNHDHPAVLVDIKGVLPRVLNDKHVLYWRR
jgi:UDP-N-acetyl-D-galactosamine dehydrogenase